MSKRNPPVTQSDFDIAFNALCAIVFLGVIADGQVARRIAQDAIQTLRRDKLQVVLMDDGTRLQVTSAAGNEQAERETLRAVQRMIDGVLEAEGSAVQWGEIVMVDDHPPPKGEAT